MDPLTLSAVLLAAVTGASEALSGQLWERLGSLVRRPASRQGTANAQAPVADSGKSELAALQQAPQDEQKARTLAEVLIARAKSDPEFERALVAWWEQAEPVRARTGNVSNTVSGGTFSGPLLQGRDFTGISFGVPAPARPASPPGDADAG